MVQASGWGGGAGVVWRKRERPHAAVSRPLVACLGVLCWRGAGAMAASNWGLCKECYWWQIEPEASLANTTMGVCIEEALQPFRLRVSGNSGCTRYMPGQPTHAAGSSAAPPTAEPQR
jgi:hypothetical protein